MAEKPSACRAVWIFIVAIMMATLATTQIIGKVHDECDGLTFLTDGRGTIQSPNYPNHYDPDSDCEIVIEAREGYAIVVEIDDFRLENPTSNGDCKYDYLKLMDGPDLESPLIRTICGYYYHSPHPRHALRSSGRQMRLLFKSDSVGQAQGFRLFYQEEPSPCGDAPEGTSGWLTSPKLMYYNYYLPGVSCTWPIVMEEGLRVKIDFYSFHMEKCPYDFLEISNGVTRQIGARTLCGEMNGAEPFISTGNQVVAYLETDRSEEEEGFRARYYAYLDQNSTNCGDHLHNESGVIAFPGEGDPQPNRHCVWTVTSVPGKHIKVTLPALTLTSDDDGKCSNFLEVRDGGYLDSSLLFKFCGSASNQQFTATSHQLYVRFKTDETNVQDQSFNLEYRTESGCGSELTTPEGIIQSPDYPNSITSNNNCIWSFKLSPHLNYVTVQLTDLNIGIRGRSYNYDTWTYGCFEGAYLLMGHVYSSYNSTSQYCGNSLVTRELDIRSWKEPVLGFFSTDGTVGRGFQLKYKAGCSVTYIGREGNLTSPNFPDPYDYPFDCEWHLRASNQVATLNISHLNLDCESQFLQIKDENGNVRFNLCGEESGQTQVLRFLTTSEMVLRYKAGPTQEGQGFDIAWNVQVCSFRLRDRSGDIVSPSYLVDVPNGFECEWNFDADDKLDWHVIQFDSISWTSCEDSPLHVAAYHQYNYEVIAICSNQTAVNITGRVTLKMKQNSFEPSNISFSGSYSRRCGGEITVYSSTYFRSQGYYETYNTPQSCHWTFIPGNPDLVVNLHLYWISIGSDASDCSQGSLTVTTPSHVYEMCGTELPVEFSYGAAASRIDVTFNVLNGSIGRGFSGRISQRTPPCRGVYTAETGSLTSPNYPENYPQYVDCEWRIVAPFGTKIELTFQDISLKQANSPYCDTILRIYNDNHGYSYVTLCHSELDSPWTITSEANKMRIVFYNYYVYLDSTHRGFNATYRFVKACGEELNSSNGTFGLTIPRRINETCRWMINVNPGKALRFYVHTFIHYNYAENGFNCDQPLTLEVSQTEDSHSLLGSLCRNGIPFPDSLLWNSNSLYVSFRNIQNNSAFSAYYEEIDMNYLCGGELSGDGGVVFSPENSAVNCPGQSHLVWVIKTQTPGHVVRLNFESFYWTYNSSFSGGRQRRNADNQCSSKGVKVEDGDSVLYENCGSSYLGTRTFFSQSSSLTLSLTSSYYIPQFTFQHSSICFNQTNTTGQIVSGPYTASYDCGWLVQLSNYNHELGLTFEEVHLAPGDGPCGPGRDRIELYQSWSASGWFRNLFATICNETTLHDTYKTTDRQLYIRLVSSSSSPGGTGFKANTSVVCHQEMRAYTYTRYLSSSLTTENGPCSWNITYTSYSNRVIRLSFTTFDLASDCEKNYLMIRDGEEETLYCSGSFHAGEAMHAKGRSLLLTYHAEEGAHSRHSGFRLSYVAVYYTPGCGGTLTSDNGIIKSPNYPNRYINNLNCIWYIYAPVGKVIQLNFNDMQIHGGSSCWDSVRVFDGRGTGYRSALSGPLCGIDVPVNAFTSTSNIMTVQFRTDGYGILRGFNSSYTFYLPSAQTTTAAPTTSLEGCGGNLTANNSIVKSPNYPNNYVNNLDCVWYISAPAGLSIQLTFEDLKIEAAGCSFDYVQVYEGHTTSPSAALSPRLCGESLPRTPYTSTTSNMTVYFKTDTSVVEKGFNSSFAFFRSPPTPPRGSPPTPPRGSPPTPTRVPTRAAPSTTTGPATTVSATCGATLSEASGYFTSPNYPSPYDHNSFCRWTVEADEGFKILLNLTDIKLEGGSNCLYDYLQVYDGPNEMSRPLTDKLCGSSMPPTPFSISTGREISVIFRTDGSMSFGGFKMDYVQFNGTMDLDSYLPEGTGCGSKLVGASGQLKSPNHPSAYNDNDMCYWYITTPLGSTVHLNFTQFHLEGNSCSYDYVRVYNGFMAYSPNQLSVDLCGEGIEQASYDSTGNQMLVFFKTDSSITRSGFAAEYQANYLTNSTEP